MGFKTGDKVYCESMNKNFVIACKEGEFAYTCIDVLYNINVATRFDKFVLSAHDLSIGWKTTFY